MSVILYTLHFLSTASSRTLRGKFFNIPVVRLKLNVSITKPQLLLETDDLPPHLDVYDGNTPRTRSRPRFIHEHTLLGKLVNSFPEDLGLSGKLFNNSFLFQRITSLYGLIEVTFWACRLLVNVSLVLV